MRRENILEVLLVKYITERHVTTTRINIESSVLKNPGKGEGGGGDYTQEVDWVAFTHNEYREKGKIGDDKIFHDRRKRKI